MRRNFDECCQDGALSFQSGRGGAVRCATIQLLLAWREHGGPALNGQLQHQGFGAPLA